MLFRLENKSIEDTLKLRIIFPDNQQVIYAVEVMKYWEYTDEELREKQMYPLLPLQLFSLRKEVHHQNVCLTATRLPKAHYYTLNKYVVHRFFDFLKSNTYVEGL